MKKAPLHPQESERIESLLSSKLLDTVSEQQFDDITFLASQICQTPMALFSLVDKNRQWFKSKQGIEARETPRDIAFCAHAILQDDIFLVPDTKKDERFHDNPLVTGDPQIQFYAGTAIRDPGSNLPIGTLCVIDSKPRNLNEQQLQALDALKRQVESLLQLRISKQKVETHLQELQSLQKRSEYILDGAALGSWDWWLDTNKVRFDRRWCEMLGYKMEEVPQHLSSWDSYVHPEDKDKAYSDIKDYLDGKSKVYQNIHRLRHKEGHWVWILDRGRISERTPDGKPLRFTGTHFDISAYKIQEQLNSQIEEVANIGAWQLDFETNKTSWSQQTYKIHGVDPQTPTDKIMGIQFYKEHEQNRLGEWIAACALRGKGKERFEFTDAKGNDKWVEVSSVAFHDANGRTIGLRGTFQDVTEAVRKENQQESDRLKAHQLAKLSSLGEIAAGVAHEINNPMAIIMGAAETLASSRSDDVKFQRKTDMIKKAIERIVRIVSGLKKYSRTAAVSNKSLHPISQIIEDSFTIAEIKASREGVQLLKNIQFQKEILCDSVEIEQVIVNLLNNSIDAVRNENQKWVLVSTTEEAGKLVLKVTDSGKGIPAAVKQKIFDPFFTTKPVGQGTGLGLSISKGILDALGADFYLCPDSPNTCFVIKFNIEEFSEKAS